MSREVTVYRSNPSRACFDFETRLFIDGTKEQPQTVPYTAFVREQIKRDVLVEVTGTATVSQGTPKAAGTEQQSGGAGQSLGGNGGNHLSVEEFAELGADAQKALLASLEIIGDGSNETKRIELYAAFIESAKE